MKKPTIRAKSKPLKAKDKIQNYLPGTAPKKIEAVHDAALDMLDKVANSKVAKKREEASREKVRAAMEKEGISDYSYGGLNVHVDLKRTPKVKLVAPKQPKEEKKK